MPSGKVTIKKEHVGAGANEFTIDILTGGSEPPQVTLASNSRFPVVRDFYARAMKIPTDTAPAKGIRLHVRFESNIPSNANEIKVNVFQEDATDFLFPHL